MQQTSTPAIPVESLGSRTWPRVLFYLEKPWIRCVLIALIGFAVRFPALSGEPLWDDDYLVRTNPFIKSPLLVLEVFRHYLFPESYSTHYRPVQNISYMADYVLWNGNFYGFHVSNVLWHVAAGLALYFLLRRLVPTLFARFSAEGGSGSRVRAFCDWLPFFVALLWIVHPVHSAAIDYVSGRADCLAVCLGASAWLLVLRADRSTNRFLRPLFYFLSCFVGLLALCSRESACLWPLLFLSHLFIFQRPNGWLRKVLPVIACALLYFSYYQLRTSPSERSDPGGSVQFTPSMRTVLMFRALGDYGRLMFFPYNLHMERSVYTPASMDPARRPAAIELEYLSLLGLAVLAGFILLGRRPGVGRGVRIFGAAWFFVTFLPISNLIELNATVAEHWLYLPSFGFILFIAGCAVELPARWLQPVMGLACAAVLALGVRSYVRSSNWVTNEIFARHTIRSGGLTIRIALMLGQVYSGRGDYKEAEKILRKAVEMCPDYPIARNNLAHALVKQGKDKEAEELFAASTKAASTLRKEYPRTWIAALNLGHMLYQDKKFEEAITVLDKARHDYPTTWELVSLESEVLRETDKLDEAMAIVRPYAEKNWWHYSSWLAWGRLLTQKGDIENAVPVLRHASWLDFHDTASLNLIAFICAGKNQMPDALRAQSRAVSRQPDQPRQYLILSDILNKMGRADEAKAALAQVTRLRSLAQEEKPADYLLN